MTKVGGQIRPQEVVVHQGVPRGTPLGTHLGTPPTYDFTCLALAERGCCYVGLSCVKKGVLQRWLISNITTRADDMYLTALLG